MMKVLSEDNFKISLGKYISSLLRGFYPSEILFNYFVDLNQYIISNSLQKYSDS